MIKTISMADFASQIETRKRELGIIDDAGTIEALRNKGGNRTPRKRAVLARIEERAVAAGRKPLRSYY